ncbi:MAG TPA: DNA cytosine methyltransferase, partial [Chondromyces sp.]|nr:DNA cytosine methyltransferase [Chondromyces sp.]
MELAGFTPLFVNELNPDAMNTYLANRRVNHPLLDRYNIHDVKNLVKNRGKLLQEMISGLRTDYGVNAKLGEVDLLVGGPPCQGFSGIGYRRSYSVDKEQLPSNHLYQDMA